MHREPGHVVIGIVGSEMVEEQKGIVMINLGRGNAPLQPDSGSFHDNPRFDDLSGCSYLPAHIALLSIIRHLTPYNHGWCQVGGENVSDVTIYRSGYPG